MKSIEKKVVITSPGKLFSLSKLQGVLGQQFKMSLKESLQIVQALYEKGYVTYPRTNTEYLAAGEKEKVKILIEKYMQQGYMLAFRDSKQIFDDSKIESHSALCPTLVEPKNLGEKEMQVYLAIKNRFLAVFCKEACKMEKSVMTIAVGEEMYTVKGTVLASKGYLQYESNTNKDKMLPNLKIGDTISIKFEPSMGETHPAKRYTTETLNNYLKNPFKTDKNTVEEDYKSMFAGVEIGTEATRTGIIENAFANGYISLKNNTYYIEGMGAYVMQALQELGIEMTKDKSVELSQTLKKVYKQEITVKEAVLIAEEQVTRFFLKKDVILTPIPEELKRKGKEIIGKCPKCGAPVYENKMAFSCNAWKEGCKFSIFKNDKYFQSLGVTNISTEIAKALLLDKKVKLGGLISKSGKKYTAIICVDYREKYPQYKMIFAKKRRG